MTKCKILQGVLSIANKVNTHGNSDMTYYPSKLLRGISLNDNFRVKVREGRFGELTEILAWYEYINDVILDHLDDEIKSTNKSGVWRYLISFKVILSFSQPDLINQIEMFLEFAPCH